MRLRRATIPTLLPTFSTFSQDNFRALGALELLRSDRVIAVVCDPPQVRIGRPSAGELYAPSWRRICAYSFDRTSAAPFLRLLLAVAEFVENFVGMLAQFGRQASDRAGRVG